ncbi:MAG TPA: glycoside hydrolase family 13 protein, partial [Ruminiclostridium sp.]|nr:glycoside hydrolase family 13 protein [Ruminiclostridium sp.]
KGGVMYQIMPDRFCRQGDIPQNLPSGRIISETWGDLPPQSDENGYCSNYYFGGNFKGITSKLPYLKSLGVTTVYINPIFEAHSYHRYNTADYSKADPLLGTDDDFRNLCEQGEQAGINIILDGVFSHTGEDSVYFNKYARYPDKGAYESKDSIYYSWYDFKKWPEIYRCWWNFKELPEVNESEPSYLDYITGKDGILQRWIKLGASGWRLDVADELPDNMIESIRNAVKDAGEENIVLGEVWEDASNKISYGQRRHYLEGKQLDSVMNYPWRYAIIDYLRTGNAAFIAEAVMTIIENYPKESLDTLMNHLGTHDTARLITCLAGENPDGKSKSWRQFTRMAPERRQRGLALVRLACAIQFMLPGIPCIYFGDEAGFEGYEDPFNRQCYNWGGEDKALVEWYRALGRLRSCCPVFKAGQYRPIMARGAVYAFERLENGEFVSVAVNAGESAESLEMNGEICVSFGNVTLSGGILTLPPKSCAILGSGSFVSSFEKVNQN